MSRPSPRVTDAEYAVVESIAMLAGCPGSVQRTPYSFLVGGEYELFNSDFADTSAPTRATVRTGWKINRRAESGGFTEMHGGRTWATLESAVLALYADKLGVDLRRAWEAVCASS